MLRISAFIFILALTSIQLGAQEICDNAIDDDADGLIDINDEDCICETLVPSSLIPNPSFEDRTCCPMENARLDCAFGWIQASPPTTDFVHTCGGYLGNTGAGAIAPLPFPDGEGGVGFRDGQRNAGIGYKEYVGTCLTTAMTVGDTYRLDFFVGFRDNVQGNMDVNIAIFGSNNCDNLPYGTNRSAGCPTNFSNYNQLGQQFVEGNGEWINVVFEFVADEAYEVIVIGPSCQGNPNFMFDPYFYVDRLALAETSEFGLPFESTTGNVCGNNLVLSAVDPEAIGYQWYQDGVALIGETNSSITLGALTNTEGVYQAVITVDGSCKLTREYDLRIPPYFAPVTTSICEDEFYVIGTDSINQAGYIEITIPAVDGCDSIVQLDLEVLPTTYFEMAESFCEGDTFEFLDIVTEVPGTFESLLVNAAGCDSIVQVDLSMISENTELDIGPDILLQLGESIDIIPEVIDLDLASFTWFDDLGTLLSDQPSLLSYQPIDRRQIYLQTTDEFGCNSTDSLSVRIDKSSRQLFIPNVFFPESANIENRNFRFYGNPALARVNSFSIFDRWGNRIFYEENIIDFENYEGWDANINGRRAESGVFIYQVDAEFLDGYQKKFSGTVTLIR